jgi:hypothetical protein
MTCDDVRLSLHEADDESVRSHLASCSACRQFEADLNALTRALRELPKHTLPADALATVWSRTSRSRPAPAWSWMTSGHTRLAAAVAVTAVSAAALYYVFAPPTVDHRAEELARASAEAALVLGYTAKALAATRNAVEDRVLVSKVSPAVRGEHAPEPRRPR